MNKTDQTTDHDINRMKRLEGELQRLIAAVDARLSERPTPRRPVTMPKEDKSWLGMVRRGSLHQIAALGGIAALLLTAGWVGSSLYYGGRLKQQVESEIKPYADELADTVASIQTDLAPRMAIADELKAEIDQARRDLLARDEELDTTITEAQSQLLSIRDSAIDDIERRLSDQTDDLSLMLEASRQRATDLDQGLGDVDQALEAFDRQLPMLTDGFGEVAAGLMESRDRLDKIDTAMTSLDGRAPAFLEVLDKH